MGVCLAAITLSDEKIQQLLDDPPLVWRVLAPDDNEPYLEAIGRSRPPGWLARLLGDKRPWPPEIPGLSFMDGERIELDMDKSWDGVNFCLGKLVHNGECPNFFEDGKPLGKTEVGYGPALCFTSKVAARIARTYGAITRNDFMAQYAPADMRGVYPGRLWENDTPDTRAYLEDNFLALQDFLRQAEQHRMGVLVYFT